MSIEVIIDSMSTDNNHAKLDINDIMKRLGNHYFPDKLEKYKPFIIEHTNYRNSETEVIYIEFVLNHTFIHIMIFYTETSFRKRQYNTRYGIVNIYIPINIIN